MLKIGIIIERLQRIKTKETDNYFFSSVILLKPKMFSKQLIPYVYDMDNGIGEQIIDMQLFEEENRKYHTVNIDSFTKIKGGFSVEYLD